MTRGRPAQTGLVWCLVFACAVLALCADRAVASPHGWIVVPAATGDRATLIHIPARSPIEGGLGAPAEQGLPAGRRQWVRELAMRPVGLAAVGDRVFLVLPAQARRAPRSDDARIRRVLSLRALPTPVAPMWYYEPPDRFESHPALPGEGEFIGIAPAGGSVAALLRTDESGFELLTLERSGWAREVLPDELQWRLGAAEDAWLLGGPAVAFVEDGRWWVASPEGDTDRWAAREVGRIDTGADDVIAVRGHRDDAAVLVRTGAGAELWRVSLDGAYRLAGIEGELPDMASPRWAMTLTDSGDRAAVVRWDAAAGADDDAANDGPAFRSRLRTDEISTRTGAVLYAGPTSTPDLVSSSALRLMMTAMFAMSIAVLVLAIRRDPLDGAVPLPNGVALAGLRRRAGALAVDVAIAFLAACWSAAVSPVSMLSVQGWFTEPNGWTVAPGTLVNLWMLGVVGESIMGATPGKIIAGCRVVALARSRPGAAPMFQARPRFTAVFVRNTLKVLLPPLLLLAILDPSRRHRAEQVSGTAVVVRPRPGDDEPGA